MKRIATLPLVLVLAGSQLGATDCGAILKDPGFDHWCGDQLCYWDVERGEVRRVGTWHAGDDGVDFVGTDVAISQMTEVDWIDTSCLEFDLVADIDANAAVHLEADVFDDGTIDVRERLPTARWERLVIRIGIRGPYQGIRFRLTKEGTGRAVLAQLGARVASGCPTAIDPVSRPHGATCLSPEHCPTGLCVDGVCAACRTDDDCDDGEVCLPSDEVPAHLQPFTACRPHASPPPRRGAIHERAPGDLGS
jgi:hypothetical protein